MTKLSIPDIENVRDLSDVRPAVDNLLCHATLVGHRCIEKHASHEDANHYFNVTIKGDCSRCPACNVCPICILEE